MSQSRIALLFLALTACSRFQDDASLRDVSNQAQVFEGPDTAIVGRTVSQADQSVVLSWPGSSIQTRFQGTSVIANLKVKTPKPANYMQVILDGNESIVLTLSPNTTQYTIDAEGEGPHTLTLVKRNESMDGDLIFSGFTPGNNGALLPTALPSGRRIEFIGDSITCGYGNEGTITTAMLTSSQSSNQNSLRDCNFFLQKKVFEVSNAYLAFGSQAARTLDAEAHLTCWSGKGVYRNADGTTNETIPDIWQRAVASDGNTQANLNDWIPQVVFINLGTNDFGSIAQSSKPSGGPPNTSEFERKYIQLLKQVREAYPNAWIYCATGPMLSNYYPTTFKALDTMRLSLKKIISTFGDKRTKFLEFPLNIASDEDATGCEWHPDVSQDAKMAKQTVLEIQQDLKWQ